jgi:hypothetical protein
LNRHCRTLHNFTTNFAATGTSDNPDPDTNSD